MKKCVVYYRVSSEQQLEGDGMARQEAAIQSYIRRTDILSQMDSPEVLELRDLGVSAFKGLNTSTAGELGRWMEEVRAGRWDGSHLVLESLDRFSRQNPFLVLGYLNELITQHQITIHDVSLSMIINMSTSSILPMVIMTAQRAYDESKLKSDRIRAGWKAKRDNAFNNGTIVTNKRPKWIDVVDNKYVLNDRSKVVVEAFRLYQTGIGCPTVAKILREKGSEWQFDRPWTAEAIHKLLKNRRVTGVIFISELIRDFNNTKTPVEQKRYEMEVYPPVISKEEFDLVQKLLKSRRNGKVVVKDESELVKYNIFTSNIRCSSCHGAMYHNRTKSVRKPKKETSSTIDEYRYLRCLNERDGLCSVKSLKYEIVEKFVIEHIKGLDFSKVIKDGEHNHEAENLRLEILDMKAHIQDYEIQIESIRNAGKKIPFKALVELEESQDKLKVLNERYAAFENVTVDTTVLTDVDLEQLRDVNNLELRSRVELELNKVLDTLELYRTGNSYVINIRYKAVDVLRHVLMIRATKSPSLISSIAIERMEGFTAYTTPTFIIEAHDSGEILLKPGEEQPPNLIDWGLLLNYCDATEGADNVAIWLRHNMNKFC